MQLTIIFRNMLPSEPLIAFARRLVGRTEPCLEHRGALQLSIERSTAPCGTAYTVALSTHASDRGCVEIDADAYSAVRNAFARLQRQVLTSYRLPRQGSTVHAHRDRGRSDRVAASAGERVVSAQPAASAQ